MKARKKLLAAALTILPLGVLAQQAEPAKPAEAPPAAPAAAPPAPPAVQVYGTFNVNLQLTKAGGATNPDQSVLNRVFLSPDSSNVGVRGTIALPASLKAIYQCETSANINGLGLQAICNRNSRIGLSGDFGTLFYGNWDTPFKGATYGTKADDPFWNTDVYGYQNLMGSPGFNYKSSAWKTATNTTITGFDIRASDSVAYWTPKYMGLGVKVQYSVNGFADQKGDINPQLYGAAINYDAGPISILGGYEHHDDSFSLFGLNGTAGAHTFGATAANSDAVKSKDDAWRVGAGYALESMAGTTTVGGLFEQLILKQNGAATGAIKEHKRVAWQVALNHRVGDHELKGRYSAADKGDCTLQGGGTCSTDGYGAQGFAVGYAYYFTKAVQGYLYYSQINNNANAQYTFATQGAPAVAGATPKGANPQALGLGLRAAF